MSVVNKMILYGLVAWVVTVSTVHAQVPPLGLRLIAVSTESGAMDLESRIRAGASFELLAREYSIDPPALAGGYLGLANSGNLRSEFPTVLANLAPGEVSSTIRLGNELVVLQSIPPEETIWQDTIEAAFEAFSTQRYTEAARLYERVLSARWADASEGEDRNSIPVLDSLAAVLSLAYFKDTEREEAYGEYVRALDMATLGENLYLAMTNMLFDVEMPEEAEHVALDAVRRFPNSRQARIELAVVYEQVDNLSKALEVFEEASRIEIPPGIDPSRDRYRRGTIQNQIGRLSMLSGRFDDAIRAYRRTLEIVPEDAIAHTALGDLYLGRDMLTEALEEYTLAIDVDPENADAYLGIAGVHLRMGRFAEAATAAGRALDIDPEHPRALYVRAMAKIRAGQNADGQRDLEVYRRQEAETQAAANRQLQIGVSNRDATALLSEGRTDEAIRLFRDRIDAQPEAWFFLMLGVRQSKMGLHQDAVEAFRAILDLDLGISFLAHWNLAREYDALGDVGNLGRQRALYLRDFDTELEARLN